MPKDRKAISKQLIMLIIANVSLDQKKKACEILPTNNTLLYAQQGPIKRQQAIS